MNEISSEDEIRIQMHRTMVAVEIAACAITDYLGLRMPRSDHDGSIILRGPVKVEGDLTVTGTTTTVESNLSSD